MYISRYVENNVNKHISVMVHILCTFEFTIDEPEPSMLPPNENTWYALAWWHYVFAQSTKKR